MHFLCAAFFIPFFYITLKAEEIGMGEGESVFLLSIIGITNTIGRVISGWIADRPWTNALHLNNGALIIAGIGTILVAFCQSYSLLCIYAAVFGFCVGQYISVHPALGGERENVCVCVCVEGLEITRKRDEGKERADCHSNGYVFVLTGNGGRGE